MTNGPVFPDHPGQLGLATRRQVRDAGFTDAQVRHATGRSWQAPFPGVLAAHRGPLDRPTLLVAAALWAGPSATLTGLLALQEHGLPADDPAVATFLVPQRARARQHPMARTIRTTRPVDALEPGGPVRLAPPVRALVDGAQYEALSVQPAEALAIAVLQRGLGTPEELEAELWQRPGNLVGGVASGLAAFREGAWSRPEKALVDAVRSEPRLPELLVNPRLETTDGTFIGVPDGYLPAAATAIQVHSRQFHQGVDDRGGDRWASTVERDSELTAHGVRVVAVAPWTLYRRPTVFLQRLLRVVELGLASPAPAIRVVPQPRT